MAYTPGDEFRLELIGSFNAEYDGTILAPLKAKTMEPVIHGQASDGSNITLFDSTCGVSYKGCAEFSTSVYKAKAIVVGTHLNNRDEKRFFKLDPLPATFRAVFVPATCGPSVNQPFLRIAARF